MKAMRLFSPAPIEEHPLTLIDQPIPDPGADHVRIKISVCGVCHTDLHTVEGEIVPPHYPITPGHQVVGKIDSFGSNAGADIRPRLHTQQRVGIPWLHWACGSCDACRRGEENLCVNARFTGFNVDGGYGEYMLADSRYVLPIPDSISDGQAAPLLCAGIVGYRSLKRAEIQRGDRVGLIGFGASAHIGLQVLNHWGCKTHVFTRSKQHQDHARELGAAWAGSIDSSTGRSLDRVVIFAPDGALVVSALGLIRPGGVVAINAIHMSDIPSFPYKRLWGERTVRSVANATYDDGVEFLNLAVQINIHSTLKMYALEEANAALNDLKHSRFNGEAVLTI